MDKEVPNRIATEAAQIDNKNNSLTEIKLTAEENRVNAISSFYYVIIFFIVGLPLWIHTTTPYRASLPNSEILFLVNKKVTVHQSLSLFSCKLSKPLDLQVLHSSLEHHFSTVYPDLLRIDITTGNCLYDPPSACDGAPGSLCVVLVDESTNFGSNASAFLDNRGRLFVRALPPIDALSKFIAELLSQYVLPLDTLWEAHARLHDLSNLNNSKSERESMIRVRQSSAYDLTFTLANLRAHSPQNPLRARWSFEATAADYLAPFLERLAPFASFSVKSQVLRNLDLDLNAELESIAARSNRHAGLRVVKEHSLSTLVNVLEKYLASYVSTNPELHFVALIPPLTLSPLSFLPSSSEVPHNSCLVMQWGSLLVLDPSDAAWFFASPSTSGAPGDEKHEKAANLRMRPLFQVFLTYLRKLLGFRDYPRNDRLDIESLNEYAPLSDWELRNWLLGRTLSSVAMARRALRSLHALLGQISNMVIRDEVAAQVHAATRSLALTLDLLASDSATLDCAAVREISPVELPDCEKLSALEAAALTAAHAAHAAESAFFDETLLELLYFPDNQKYAVYMPLFLPVSIPLVLSFWDVINWYRS